MEGIYLRFVVLILSAFGKNKNIWLKMHYFFPLVFHTGTTRPPGTTRKRRAEGLQLLTKMFCFIMSGFVVLTVNPFKLTHRVVIKTMKGNWNEWTGSNHHCFLHPNRVSLVCLGLLGLMVKWWESPRHKSFLCGARWWAVFTFTCNQPTRTS